MFKLSMDYYEIKKFVILLRIYFGVYRSPVPKNSKLKICKFFEDPRKT